MSEATEAPVLYDNEALYVGVRFADRGRVSTGWAGATWGWATANGRAW